MLSALIPAEHSYPALHLVVKPVDQRSVHPDPLVQRSTSLKRQRLQQIETNLSHAYNLDITNPLLLTVWTIPPPFDCSQGDDVLWKIIIFHPVIF